MESDLVNLFYKYYFDFIDDKDFKNYLTSLYDNI